MPNKAYLDEFKNTYERPQVDGLIVGFSGIDPQKKREVISLSPEQQNILKQLILNEISIDGGCNCDPSKLSDEQLDIISNLINNKLIQLNFNFDSGDIDENIKDETLDDDPESGGGGGGDGSGGGGGDYNPPYEDNEFFIQPAPIAEINPALIDHEEINHLLGGDDNGHYHLTHDELKRLRLLISAFFPYSGGGDDNDDPDSNSNDPDVMVMPQSIIQPGPPITPVDPQDVMPTDPDALADYDPHFGMPSSTPPAWEIVPFPAGFTADSGFNKIYYGGTNKNPNQKTLAVYVDKKGNDTYIEYVITSTDARNWITNNKERMPHASNFKTVFDVFLEPTYNYMYAIYENKLAQSSAYNFNYRTSSSSATIKSVEEAISMCWAEPLKALLVVGKTGYVTSMRFPSATTKILKVTSIHQVGMPVNRNGAAFSPTNQVFCLCGAAGTAVSSDGQSWFVNPDAPKNMTGLIYRDDLDAFFAYSLNDKLFYYSNDGGNWTKASNAPIPLNNITAVDVNPVTKVVCAAGLGDKGAYFSKDLNHWTYTSIRNTTTDIAGLISLPDKGLYVAIPTSGSYYYIFDYNKWANS